MASSGRVPGALMAFDECVLAAPMAFAEGVLDTPMAFDGCAPGRLMTIGGQACQGG
jgi:hypothetical protein